MVQLRAKNCAMEEVRRLAEKIGPIVQGAGAALVINEINVFTLALSNACSDSQQISAME